jgi:hypothetical protein
MRQSTAAAESKQKTTIMSSTRDRRAARALRLEILDQFAESGNETDAIAALTALAASAA